MQILIDGSIEDIKELISLTKPITTVKNATLKLSDDNFKEAIRQLKES